MFQAEDGIRGVERSRGLGDVYKRQVWDCGAGHSSFSLFSCHRFCYEFPFPVTHAQSVGILMQGVGMAPHTLERR